MPEPQTNIMSLIFNTMLITWIVLVALAIAFKIWVRKK